MILSDSPIETADLIPSRSNDLRTGGRECREERQLVLRELDGLRLTLETDRSLAASAVEAGATAWAVDLIAPGRAGLRAFEGWALEHLTLLPLP